MEATYSSKPLRTKRSRPNEQEEDPITSEPQTIDIDEKNEDSNDPEPSCTARTAVNHDPDYIPPMDSRGRKRRTETNEIHGDQLGRIQGEKRQTDRVPFTRILRPRPSPVQLNPRHGHAESGEKRRVFTQSGPHKRPRTEEQTQVVKEVAMLMDTM